MSWRERCWDRPLAARLVVSPFARLWRVRSTCSNPEFRPGAIRTGAALGPYRALSRSRLSSLLVSRISEAFAGE
jgi:hypothetical protein